MDPKVCGKLLTTHRRGLGDDVEALHGRFPSDEAPAKAPRWDLASDVFGVHGYIYRRKKRVSGLPSGPRERGAHPVGGHTLHPRGRLVYFLTSTPSPLDHVRSKNHDPEGFIPFGLRLIFFFFKTLK